MTFLIPHDESLSIIGPFMADQDVQDFREKHLHGFGVEVRESCTPEDWMAAMEESEEEP